MASSLPSIPPLSPRSSRRGEEEEGILSTPRKLQEGLEAFGNMRKAGAGLGDALFSMFTGRKMTQEQAALCIQSHWKRYHAETYYQECRGAAITIQAGHRAHLERQYLRAQAEAAARLQARLRGNFTRDVTDFERHDYRSATTLQSAWRGRTARMQANKLRWQNQSRLKRTFSWGRKKTPKARAAASPATPCFSKASAATQLPGRGQPIRRSVSFDRFTRTKQPASSTSSHASTTPSNQFRDMLFILLSRGPNGLGLELDATNTIVNMVKGGAADAQGHFKVGDTIASVDGTPLRNRLLQEVMDPRKSTYSFDVWRLSRVEPEPKAEKPLRRALSFDRRSKR